MEGGRLVAACHRPSIYPLDKKFRQPPRPAEAVRACCDGVVGVCLAYADQRPSIYPLNKDFPNRLSPENAGLGGVGLRRRRIRAPAR